MDLYKKNKKKNNEDYSNDQSEFGSISREIDDILNDTPKSEGSEDKYHRQDKIKEDTINEQNQQHNKDKTNGYSSESSTPPYDTPSNEEVYEIKQEKSHEVDSINNAHQEDNHSEYNEQYDAPPSEASEDMKSESNDNYKFELSLPKIGTEKQNNDSISSENTPQDSDQWHHSNQIKSDTQKKGKKIKSFSLFSKNKKQSSTDEQSSESMSDEIPSIRENTKQDIQINDGEMDEEVLKLLGITDELLGKLPEEVINEFASSQDFELYKRVMNRYNIIK